MLRSINPFTGKLIQDYTETSNIEEKVRLSNKAFKLWKYNKDKAQLMQNAADILEDRAEELAQLMTLEMGKPISEGIAEAKKCAWVCRYYADNAGSFLKPKYIETDATESFLSYQPLGVILAVMPWNFPFWQVFRFAAPTLMAGNVGILKHSSNVSGCSLAIEQIFLEAGFPENVFTSLLIKSDKVASVIENPLVRAVTLTGSNFAGESVAEVAGRNIKKCVLELGGNDPYIILKDADVDLAVEKCLASKIINSGQSCIAMKRIIVQKQIAEKFIKKFTTAYSSIEFDDPLKTATKLGPMATIALRDELHKQVMDSVKLGAELLCGGFIPENPGAFYPATILTNVTKGMPAYNEELFGPVASIIIVESEEEAINIANDSDFGLGTAVFTGNIPKGKRIAEFELQAGCCSVNDFVRSDPRLPFGGIKQSGYGRELGEAGIKEFVNEKTVYIK
jgi:succinate-semialdehyde dehydrogenase / glutarate-semialdehyde dehydrogenase